MIDLRDYAQGDKRKLDAELAGLIRSEDYAQIEAILLAHLSSSDGDLARLATSIGSDAVKIEHWDRISRTHTMQGQTPLKITAIGLDLDLYAGDYKPVLLANYYADIVLTPERMERHDFWSFTGKDRAAIMAACATYPAPWQGEFDEIDLGPEILGLDLLYNALEVTPASAGQQKPESEEASLDRYAARWWLLLRLHQAIHRDLAKVSLPHCVPIIISGHGWPEWCHSVHYPSAIGSPDTIGDTLPPTHSAPNDQNEDLPNEPHTGERINESNWEQIFESARRETGDRLYNEINRLAAQARQKAEDVTKRFDAEDLEEIKRAADIVGSVLRKWVGR